jgi:hypothetical protein
VKNVRQVRKKGPVRQDGTTSENWGVVWIGDSYGVKGGFACQWKEGLVYGTVQCRRQLLRRDTIPQEKKLLRRTQEPEYRTEKIKSLVYVV